MDTDVHPDNEWVVPIIRKRAQEKGLALEGPVQTEYGFGWDPTSPFWLGHRRVHLYYGFVEKNAAIEVSDLSLKRVERAAINDSEVAWEIIRRFLGAIPSPIIRHRGRQVQAHCPN